MNWKYGLDVLRALAILLVLLYHYELPEGYFWSEVYIHLQKNFRTGVHLFFVLSGFLISSHWFYDLKTDKPTKNCWKDFYIKRTFRIFPLYYLVLLFEALRASFLTKTDYSLLSYLSLTQNIFGTHIFPVSWSLCVEEHFYLFFPVISFFAIRKFKIKNFIPIILILAILSPLLRSFYLAELIGRKTTFIHNTIFQLDGLSIGVLLGYIKIYRNEVWSALEKHLKKIEILGILLIAFAFYRGGKFLNEQDVIMQPMLFAFGYGCFVFSGNFKGSILNLGKNRLIPFTAKLAYPLYLTHYPAWMFLGIGLSFFKIELYGPVKILVYFVSAYLLAYIAHILIENPFLKLRKRFI